MHSRLSIYTLVSEGCLKDGCELISQALGLFTNVYGALHQDVCVCLRLLGRIHYILGDYAEVLPTTALHYITYTQTLYLDPYDL